MEVTRSQIRCVVSLRAFVIFMAFNSFVSSRVLLSRQQGASGENPCGKYTIISARGTGEPQANPKTNGGFIKGVESKVPGGNHYEVVYPALPNFATGPVIAADDMVRYVESVKDKCPNQPYVLMGYSQGAMAVVQSLMRPEMQNKDIAAVVMYGDPYWLPDAPQNGGGKGTATAGKGAAAMTGMKLPPQYASKTLDICRQGDIVCTGKGGLISHIQYLGSTQEAEAIDFAVKKLNMSAKRLR